MLKIIVVIVLPILTCLSHSFAAPLSCETELNWPPNELPFQMGESDLLKYNELRFLQKVFDRYASEAPDQLAPVTTNPFRLVAYIRVVGKEYQVSNPEALGGSKLRNTLGPKYQGALLRILRKVVVASYASAKGKAYLELPEGQWVQVVLFGIRYFLNEGEINSYLPPHRDRGFRLQGLVTLRRSRYLKDSETLVAWPAEPLTELTRGYLTKKQESEITQVWEPKAKLNQLMIFNGDKAVHGTSHFDLTDAPSLRKNTFARDMLGIAFDPRPKEP